MSDDEEKMKTGIDRRVAFHRAKNGTRVETGKVQVEDDQRGSGCGPDFPSNAQQCQRIRPVTRDAETKERPVSRNASRTNVTSPGLSSTKRSSGPAAITESKLAGKPRA